MGYKYSNQKVKCPIFHRVVKTSKGQFICIECEALDINLGFDVAHAIRLKNSQDLEDYIDIFCKYNYEDCPYYKMQTQKKEES